MANKKYDSIIQQLKRNKNDIILYIQSFVSEENMEKSIIEAGEYVRKNFFTRDNIPAVIDSKIGYSKTPTHRRQFENYVTDVIDRIKDIEGHDSKLAILETIDCIIEDLQNEE